jgi:hypothetical protein
MSEPPAPERPTEPLPPPPPLAPLEEVIANTERVEQDVTLVGMFARNLTRAVLIASVPLLIGMVMITGAWVASAVPPIRTARAATMTAEADYHAALRQSQPLLTELSALRVSPVHELETAWFTFEEAPATDVRQAADQLMTVYITQVSEARKARGDSVAHLASLLSNASRARRRASDAWHAWVDSTSSLRGRAVVVFGLADAPPADLARYDQPLPDEDLALP